MPSACDVRAWSRGNRNGLETHDRGGRIEDSKGECVREGVKKCTLKYVAGVIARVKLHRKKSPVFTLVCLLKVAQEKVTCLYTRLSSKSRRKKSTSMSALGHQINTLSN